jgi:hypothetical protein
MKAEERLAIAKHARNGGQEMSNMKSSLWSVVMLTLSVLTMPQVLKADQSWHTRMGAESRDMSRQAMAFLPNELWIRHAI